MADSLAAPSIISAVNWAEVLSWYGLRGDDPVKVSTKLALSGIIGQAVEIVPASKEDALEVSRILSKHPRAGLSLGDRFCLALAVRTKRPVITADRLWSTLDLGVEIINIR